MSTELNPCSAINFVTFASNAHSEQFSYLQNEEAGLGVAFWFKCYLILWTSMCHCKNLSLPVCHSSHMYISPEMMGTLGCL